MYKQEKINHQIEITQQLHKVHYYIENSYMLNLPGAAFDPIGFNKINIIILFIDFYI